MLFTKVEISLSEIYQVLLVDLIVKQFEKHLMTMTSLKLFIVKGGKDGTSQNLGQQWDS